MKTSGASAQPWWEQTRVHIALILCAAIPLLWPDIPPLTDLPGHIGRYRVELDFGSSPFLKDYYRFDWHLIGNLGVDLLIIPLSKLFGLEWAVKLIVVATPVLTTAGLIAIAREVHGRLPPSVIFALPLAYGYPFQFGFINFSLSVAFALLAFALWLRLGRLGRNRLRAMLFLPIGLALWITHTFGWGLLGLLCFCAELIRRRHSGHSLPNAAFMAALHCIPMAPPAILMLVWRSGQVGGQTGDWFNFAAKTQWLVMALRDRWKGFDIASVTVLLGVILLAVRGERTRISALLGLGAAALLVIYILLPRIVFGSAYADMRLMPYLLAISIIAIALKPGTSLRFAHGVAIAALAFFLTRTISTTVSFALYSQRYDEALAALDHVPRGTRLISFVGHECGQPWLANRLEHLPALAIARREAFSNDQWAMAGAQLLSISKSDASGFVEDRSQFVSEQPCRPQILRSLNEALSEMPRNAFDYIWLIEPPRFDAGLLNGTTRIWTNGTDSLYRIDKPKNPSKK
jgi:hypothetical protein